MKELIVFAKAPLPGAVKTRLAQRIGKNEACDAYKILLRVLAKGISDIPHGVVVAFTPDGGDTLLKKHLPVDWRWQPQGHGDLGARLQRAFQESFGRGARRVVVIGSDCPYVNRADIEAAWEALNRSDVVLGPATDGGYWLLGTNSHYPDLFEGLGWGTETVMRETLERAAALGLKVTLLRELSDIDTVSDWNHFQQSALWRSLHAGPAAR